MEDIKRRFANLLSIKSLVTLILTIVFGYLSVIGDIKGSEFLTVFVTVIGFYYGTQAKK